MYLRTTKPVAVAFLRTSNIGHIAGVSKDSNRDVEKISELPLSINTTSSFHEKPEPYSGIKIEVQRLIEIQCLERQGMDVFGRSTVPFKSPSWFHEPWNAGVTKCVPSSMLSA